MVTNWNSLLVKVVCECLGSRVQVRVRVAARFGWWIMGF
jgi:hypothetical protein